ncbi:MAG TPA: glycosyl transferase family protein [Novosphingobium sp.]|nr:glycosyl transferase family protein [Novosphingobium sp.]
MAESITSALISLQWLQLVEHELLVFAMFWFIIGIVDEAAIDLTWLWLRLSGRATARRRAFTFGHSPLAGKIAVFVPAWREEAVIGTMLRHALGSWRQPELVVYVGCYRNDPATIAAAMAGIAEDTRVRLVIHDRDGPTTKADCLNRLYQAMGEDERCSGKSYRGVVFHDAEDMVHPSALAEIDRALDEVDFVQLPVRPEPQSGSRWIAGHYADEFCEAHAKAMVVRDALRAGIPAAGVGCGFARDALAELARQRAAEGETGPFAAQCLTEDYELGLLISRSPRGSRFLRLRDSSGALIATRSYFPASLSEAVRQKTRWVHGIAFQSWDRLGWSGRPVDIWMALRDRRGPLTALVLAAAYLLLVIETILWGAGLAGWTGGVPLSPMLRAMLLVSFAGFAWRALLRFAFTTAEYGLAEGLRAVPRIPLANLIAIMAGRRALVAYFRSLWSDTVVWEKTRHAALPAPLARLGILA